MVCSSSSESPLAMHPGSSKAPAVGEGVSRVFAFIQELRKSG